jgi:hypothetical protein
MNKIVYNNITWYLNKGYYWNFTYGKLHRYIWIEHNGPIPKGLVVHHIDEDKTNNDISNLMLLSNKEHTYIHQQSTSTQQRITIGKEKHKQLSIDNEGHKPWSKKQIAKYKKGEGIYYW